MNTLKPKKVRYSSYNTNGDIRYRVKNEVTMERGEEYETSTYEFEVYRKPWFLGFLRKKRWINVGEWMTIEFGNRYANSVLSSRFY